MGALIVAGEWAFGMNEYELRYAISFYTHRVWVGYIRFNRGELTPAEQNALSNDEIILQKLKDDLVRLQQRQQQERESQERRR